ncbi:hypothetical protein PYCCODRAFT_1426761 [Trametes coccinea BRFM310]|uniref:Uncharacterized protein n=1 Tax=Trametes coccinea (strain BRFM310) TaxID=1353009 RepID=A0A1Y2II01_TRAC3|nr:hypothetical protein PYCCODRAFT_1426761 [Trametes coccinea BRFM310]
MLPADDAPSAVFASCNQALRNISRETFPALASEGGIRRPCLRPIPSEYVAHQAPRELDVGGGDPKLTCVDDKQDVKYELHVPIISWRTHLLRKRSWRGEASEHGGVTVIPKIARAPHCSVSPYKTHNKRCKSEAATAAIASSTGPWDGVSATKYIPLRPMNWLKSSSSSSLISRYTAKHGAASGATSAGSNMLNAYLTAEFYLRKPGDDVVAGYLSINNCISMPRNRLPISLTVVGGPECYGAKALRQTQSRLDPGTRSTAPDSLAVTSTRLDHGSPAWGRIGLIEEMFHCRWARGAGIIRNGPRSGDARHRALRSDAFVCGRRSRPSHIPGERQHGRAPLVPAVIELASRPYSSYVHTTYRNASSKLSRVWVDIYPATSRYTLGSDVRDINPGVERTLRSVAESSIPSLNYDQFLDRVILHKQWLDEPVSPNKTMYIHKVLVREAKGHRLRLVLRDGVRVVFLTPKGIAQYSYLAWEEPLRLGPRHRHGEKTFLVEDYLRLASTVRAIIRACDITSPREYQWDIRNLPSLVQANLDTVEYLSEVNQGIIDSNMAVCDRLHALDPTYLTHTHA